jgi:hypothetical protein
VLFVQMCVARYHEHFAFGVLASCSSFLARHSSKQQTVMNSDGAGIADIHDVPRRLMPDDFALIDEFLFFFVP